MIKNNSLASCDCHHGRVWVNRASAVLGLGALLGACSSPTTISKQGQVDTSYTSYMNVTFLVTNATCSMGACAPLLVFAYPSIRMEPAVPYFVVLGIVTTSSACLTIPDSGVFTLISSGDTTIVPWTVADNFSVAAHDTLTQGLLFPVQPTPEFVPQSQPGWSLTVPGGTAAVPAKACTS
jgi:hypothetical protein